jgi:hypothetical protein
VVFCHGEFSLHGKVTLLKEQGQLPKISSRAGEHRPEVIRMLLGKMLPRNLELLSENKKAADDGRHRN